MLFDMLTNAIAYFERRGCAHCLKDFSLEGLDEELRKISRSAAGMIYPSSAADITSVVLTSDGANFIITYEYTSFGETDTDDVVIPCDIAKYDTDRIIDELSLRFYQSQLVHLTNEIVSHQRSIDFFTKKLSEATNALTELTVRTANKTVAAQPVTAGEGR